MSEYYKSSSIGETGHKRFSKSTVQKLSKELGLTKVQVKQWVRNRNKRERAKLNLPASSSDKSSVSPSFVSVRGGAGSTNGRSGASTSTISSSSNRSLSRSEDAAFNMDMDNNGAESFPTFVDIHSSGGDQPSLSPSTSNHREDEDSGDEDDDSAFPSFVSPFTSQDDISLKSEASLSPSQPHNLEGDFFESSGNESPPTTVLPLEENAETKMLTMSDHNTPTVVPIDDDDAVKVENVF